MIDFIELAKECGACDFIGNDDRDLPKIILTHDQLTAFANAIVDECKVAVNDVLGDKTLASEAARRALDALKVKG